MIKCAIVEDEEEFIQILKQYMDSFQKQNNCFIELSIFRNGQEILDSNQKFDLIFMDIDMPIMDGMTAAKKMRELDSQFVLVFFHKSNDYLKKSPVYGHFRKTAA